MKNNAWQKANAKKLESFVSLALQKVGVPVDDADLTARILIDADLRGIDTHGVINLHSYYVKKVQNGMINARPNIKISYGSPTTASMDGDNGLGFIVSHKAMSEAIKMAGEYGTGWVTVCNSNHCGAGAYYVLMAAKQDMIGIHFSSGGSTVAGPGGSGRLIGNNVMAVAAPAKKYAPFVLDMAPTMTIANKLRMMEWDNKSIPEGWTVDSKGRSIIDPHTYFAEKGAILPLGSNSSLGVHKGFGLLLVSDILTGLLSGDGGSMLRRKGAESHVFCALRIDAFPSGGEFKDLMDAMIEKIHTAPTVAGAEPMRYPGEREELVYKERKANGIPLHPKVVDDLRKMSEELNLNIDNIWV